MIEGTKCDSHHPQAQAEPIITAHQSRKHSSIAEEHTHKIKDLFTQHQAPSRRQRAPTLVQQQNDTVNMSRHDVKQCSSRPEAQVSGSNTVQRPLLPGGEAEVSNMMSHSLENDGRQETNGQPDEAPSLQKRSAIEDEVEVEVATVAQQDKHRHISRPSLAERNRNLVQNPRPHTPDVLDAVQVHLPHFPRDIQRPFTGNDLEGSTNEPHKPSSRMSSYKVQKQKSKSKSSNKQSTSHSLGQTFHSADVLEILRRKMETEHFELHSHLQAERARHQIQLNDMQTKIHDQVMALQTDNERLHKDYKASTDRLRAYQNKFKQMKVYTDGVSNDLHHLRFEQNKMVDKCEEIIREQYDAQCREAELKAELVASLKDAERLDSELQSAHLAHTLLLERNCGLERQLGDTGGQLAEERTKSIRFQEELDKLSNLYAEFTSTLENTKNEHTKQLEAVNKAFTDSANGRAVDEKMEQCLRLINQGSRKEDISGMSNSLTEFRTTIQAL